MRLRELFSEGLGKDQKRKLYSDLKNMKYDRHRWAEVFGNKYRLYFDYHGDRPGDETPSSKYHDDIGDALWNIGKWKITRDSYKQGIATRENVATSTVKMVLKNDPMLLVWQEDIKNGSTDHSQEVFKAVYNRGYVFNPFSIETYRRGILTKVAPESVSIGKILSGGVKGGVIDASILKKYMNDPARVSVEVSDADRAYNDKLMIVISRHPDDIGSMSFDRRWNNCMNFDLGQFRSLIPIEIVEGTLVAYLIRANDQKIEDPYARILIKPFISEVNGEIALGVQDKVYPATAPIDFSKQVVEWVNGVNTSRKLSGLFKLNPRVYDDNPGENRISVNVNDDYVAYMKASVAEYLLRDIAGIVYDEFVSLKLDQMEQDAGYDWLVDAGYAEYDEEEDGYDIDREGIIEDDIHWVDYDEDARNWRDTVINAIKDLDINEIKTFASHSVSGYKTSTEEFPEIVSSLVYQVFPYNFPHAAAVATFISKHIAVIKDEYWRVEYK